MRPQNPQFEPENEYSLPGDEPMKHDMNTNVQFDWYRHLPEKQQKSLSPTGDHAAAWNKHTEDQELEHRYDAEIHEKPKEVGLPGQSLRSYYSKKPKKKK